MRRVRYQVACSLDGFIAGPDGEYDWIVMDPDIDFKQLFAQFDTLLMGRKTFEAAGAGGMFKGAETIVFSRTLDPKAAKGVRIVRDDPAGVVAELKARPGKDIWLFGGGALFRALLEAGCVDTVEPAVIPVMLGEGIPFLPGPALQKSLVLTGHHVYPKSGIVLLQYDVKRESPRATSSASKRKAPKPAKKA
jgi:dihydrofolate reductase